MTASVTVLTKAIRQYAGERYPHPAISCTSGHLQDPAGDRARSTRSVPGLGATRMASKACSVGGYSRGCHWLVDDAL
jgi:hypothetical protein